MQAFKNKTILQILDKYKDLWAIGHVSAVSHWDLETYMPQKGAGARGQALGRLATIRQRLFLDPAFTKLLVSAGKQKLNDQEKAVVRTLVRALKFYEKLPSKFIEDFEILTNKATVVWREAKEKNNFKIFEKDLAKIFDMNKQAAEYLGYKDSPYDALLDQFEEDLTSKEVESFFSEIKQPLKDLLGKIKNSKNYQKTHFLEKAKYDRSKIETLNTKILKTLWSDMERFRLDISSHPFTTSFSNTDTRITTWYHKTDFGRSLLATVHEFGHALYDLQSADELEMTPIEGGSSLVIHESQSRFWENFIGRSEPFIQFILKDAREAVKTNISASDIYSYFNKVRPGLLRVEADEVTYHFHIMLRYEIEKGLIEGKLKVRDLPEIWNAKMKEYLGVTPKKDSDGVLQDIHWSGGMVGYFPTYSLGTFLGAQWEEKMNLESGIKNIGKIESWLKEHIHKYGSTYTMLELLTKNKMKFDPSVNLNYLNKKYS
ncbi:MAG TPA: carboxypeptidase M32 [Patescibacteria group bacterium]|nr:carboxypeptidase M32 [Patescibacteria group bacterium]